jgi:uncharacterized protein
MKSKLIHSAEQKTWAIIFDTGDEVVSGLKQFARDNRLSAAQFTAIGAFQNLVAAFYNMEKKDYKKIPIAEQVEVLSMVGDICLKGGEPELHAHVVVGKSDATAHGGHLVEGYVRPTLEVILTESPKHLERAHDPETGLALIDLSL